MNWVILAPKAEILVRQRHRIMLHGRINTADTQWGPETRREKSFFVQSHMIKISVSDQQANVLLNVLHVSHAH